MGISFLLKNIYLDTGTLDSSYLTKQFTVIIELGGTPVEYWKKLAKTFVKSRWHEVFPA